MNLFILDKEYNKIGILSNQGAAPIAPFFDDKYIQELDTGADTYEFSTIYTYQTQELMEIGNHIIFEFNNEHKLFVIVDVTYSHKNGMHTIDVYAEGIGFELLEKYIDKFEVEGNFKNLLGIVLVGTGWEHEVGSKVNGIKKVKYDGEKNILAIIQDAIKTYDGAEVKFEVDYSNNKIKKKVRVYENGGRGSHIGYRFEYGQNVNGVTKKEEIANSKDDTIVFTNDNDIGLLLEYNVDVAMRSEEIAQLEIGDTHYVIDHDFIPPLTLEARVGKLEISFSDSTKNKVTLANFKNATGAISQKTNKGDVSDIAGNVVQQIITNGEHTHDMLVKGASTFTFSEDSWLDASPSQHEAAMYIGNSNLCCHSYYDDNNKFEYAQVFYDVPSTIPPTYWHDEDDGTSYLNTARVNIFNPYENMVPYEDNGCRIGRSDRRYINSYITNMHSDVVDSKLYYLPFDRKYMTNVSKITDSSDVSKKDLYDFIANDLNIYKYIPDCDYRNISFYGNESTRGLLGVLAEDFLHPDHTSDDCYATNITATIMGRNMNADIHDHYYSLSSLVCALIGAFQYHVANTSSIAEEASVASLSEYATVTELEREIRTKDEQIANLEARLTVIEAMLGINNDN